MVEIAVPHANFPEASSARLSQSSIYGLRTVLVLLLLLPASDCILWGCQSRMKVKEGLLRVSERCHQQIVEPKFKTTMAKALKAHASEHLLESFKRHSPLMLIALHLITY